MPLEQPWGREEAAVSLEETVGYGGHLVEGCMVKGQVGALGALGTETGIQVPITGGSWSLVVFDSLKSILDHC